ncbi:MAG: sugar nucleotide-binding protein [Planctomycetales bacterium]
MEKLLVTGVDGVLGSNLALALSDQFEVLGLYHRKPVSLDGRPAEPLDLANPRDALDLLRDLDPDWVIHCGPQSRSSWDDVVEDPDQAFAEDSRFVGGLVQAAEQIGCRTTVMSTDAVFVGPRLFHDEYDRLGGECLLAKAARKMEQQLYRTQALVVRTHAYGWSPTDHDLGHAEETWKTLSSGDRCRVDADRHATPILASDLAEMLLRAYRMDLHGVYHITGAERVSPFRFAAELARAFGLSGRHVQLEAPEAYNSNRRLYIQESSLNSRRARRILKTPMPMLREGLTRFAEQAANGFRGRIQHHLSAEPIRQKAA